MHCRVDVVLLLVNSLECNMLPNGIVSANVLFIVTLFSVRVKRENRGGLAEWFNETIQW